VWSVECGVWSVECGVWSVECGVWMMRFSRIDKQIYEKANFDKFCFPFSAFRFPLPPSF